MSRLDELNGTQRTLIEGALCRGSTLEQLAGVCHVHPRTLRDWRREKHRMSYEALRRLRQHTGLALPLGLKILPEFWHIREAARLGGQRHAQLYGPPGTPEGRRKGGRISSERFRSHPELAKALGFILRKPIKRPRESILLAEFVGIMLGDGCLSSHFQVGISFNAETDAAYGDYLQRLFQDLFGVRGSIQRRRDTHGWTVVGSSRALVEYLQTIGLVRGNKVAHQVDVPSWIWTRRSYQLACLRGLMDTDGSIYRYRHRVYGHRYRHVGLCFANHSKPLLRSVEAILRRCGFRPRVRPYGVYLNRQDEIQRYFRTIGSHNLKHSSRFCQYFGEVREPG